MGDVITIWFIIAVLVFAIFALSVAWFLSSLMKDSAKIQEVVLISLPISLILLVWFLAWAMLPLFFGWPENAGASGDMFGSISSLFSGLAFAGLIITLVLQKAELSLQRRELQETRQEFERQRFENRYFSTINLLNEHIANIQLPAEAGTNPDSSGMRGGAVLEYFASELLDELDGNMGVQAPVGVQIQQYLQLYDLLCEPSLGPYFRLMYNCMRQIELSNATSEEKELYSKILRAQLSSPEVKLLLFNCSTHWGADFKPIVEKYRLLKHLPSDYKSRNPSLVSKFSHLG